jgi:hypothetical protein
MSRIKKIEDCLLSDDCIEHWFQLVPNSMCFGHDCDVVVSGMTATWLLWDKNNLQQPERSTSLDGWTQFAFTPKMRQARACTPALGFRALCCCEGTSTSARCGVRGSRGRSSCPPSLVLYVLVLVWVQPDTPGKRKTGKGTRRPWSRFARRRIECSGLTWENLGEVGHFSRQRRRNNVCFRTSSSQHHQEGSVRKMQYAMTFPSRTNKRHRDATMTTLGSRYAFSGLASDLPRQ